MGGGGALRQNATPHVPGKWVVAAGLLTVATLRWSLWLGAVGLPVAYVVYTASYQRLATAAPRAPNPAGKATVASPQRDRAGQVL